MIGKSRLARGVTTCSSHDPQKWCLATTVSGRPCHKMANMRHGLWICDTHAQMVCPSIWNLRQIWQLASYQLRTELVTWMIIARRNGIPRGPREMIGMYLQGCDCARTYTWKNAPKVTESHQTRCTAKGLISPNNPNYGHLIELGEETPTWSCSRVAYGESEDGVTLCPLHNGPAGPCRFPKPKERSVSFFKEERCDAILHDGSRCLNAHYNVHFDPTIPSKCPYHGGPSRTSEVTKHITSSEWQDYHSYPKISDRPPQLEDDE